MRRTAAGTPTERRYIVDIFGGLPTILLEIDKSASSLTKTYIHADSQILAQHNGSHTAAIYFYLHDRLSSVRQIIDTTAAALFHNPHPYIAAGFTRGYPRQYNTHPNPFPFTAQYHDTQINEYHLRARQYNPYLQRFTARDPVFGKYKEPLTLHECVYCCNGGSVR